ncbi:DUF4232 domain-containing protein [Streptomyces sp. NPDC056519]|uniref:DUF4232 domain-containing protein n=1 Tax=Streptomyces sp. NPDC056519 TaxID=3345849 RepID=UPI0036ADB176
MNPSRHTTLRTFSLLAVVAMALGYLGLAAASARAEARPPAPCREGQVAVSAGRADPAAGQLTVPLRFRSTNRAVCSLYGYPGVSAVDAHGRRIGAPAERNGQQPVNVVLAPGTTGTATVMTADGTTGGGRCRPAAAGLRVYPPGLYRSQFVPVQLRVCGGEFGIGPVTAAQAR